MKITSVFGQEILDSNGKPTLEVEVKLEDGTCALGQVPSGASTGKFEAVELRDGDQTRYFGKGVLGAVENVNVKLNQLLVGQDASDQSNIDQLMIEADGTDNKANLGANAMVGTSMAVCRAAARSQKMPLYRYFGQLSGQTEFQMPQPMILIMEGGKHGNWATDIQEFMIVPQRDKFSSFREMLRAGAEIFLTLGKILKAKNYSMGVGFEGAYAPEQLQSNQEAFDLILTACEQAGYHPGEQIKLAVDIAASEFMDNGNYQLRSEENRILSADDWLQQVVTWATDYPIASIEDPFDQADWSYWSALTAKIGNQQQIVGDDLVVTNVKLIQQAIDQRAMNATLIKPNQIGTITETLAAIKLSTEAGFKSVVSHRSGETNDDLIADLVVGTAADQSKFGGPDRGERLAKYNRLLRIERELTNH